MKDKIINFVKESYMSTAGHYKIQQIMQSSILEFLFKNNIEGDVLEIGAHEGYHTVPFLEIAKKYNRKVFVLDPYDGNQQGNENVYNTFLTNTKKYNNLVHLREPSQSEHSIDLIKKNKFAYCFIDGLHTVEAIKSDFINCVDSIVENGIICIDDLEMPGLNNVINEVIKNTEKVSIITKPEHFTSNEVYEKLQERNIQSGYNSFGIFNPGHKIIEFFIKNNTKNV